MIGTAFIAKSATRPSHLAVTTLRRLCEFRVPIDTASAKADFSVDAQVNFVYLALIQSYLFVPAPSATRRASPHVMSYSRCGGRLVRPLRREDVVVDRSGNIFVTGTTRGANWDVFVMKLIWRAALDKVFQWSLPRHRNALAVYSDGNVVVTGYSSCGFNPLSTAALVLKFSGSGDLLWSKYLGGAMLITGSRIAVDAAGNIVVTGDTRSPRWLSGGFDNTLSLHSSDSFILKLDPLRGELWGLYVGIDRVEELLGSPWTTMATS